MLTGIFAALVFPAIAFITAYLLRYSADIINRPALPYFIAIAINLVLIRISLKKGLNDTAKGIMLATFVCMVFVILFKVHPIR